MAPTLSASKWDKKKGGWVIPRPIYLVWWGFGNEKYVVADNIAMAIRKARIKWKLGKGTGVGAKILYRVGVKKPPYGPPKVHLR